LTVFRFYDMVDEPGRIVFAGFRKRGGFTMSHPTHGCGIGRALLCVLALLGVCAYAADLADWPIGHLKITPGPDDTINVEARCVATADLITQLAALSGSSAVHFDEPCRTYVSISRPDRYEPPAFWIQLAATFGYLAVSREDSVWRVRPISGAYDSSLTDDEIYREYRKDSSSPLPMPAGQGVSSGVLIYDGVFVPPPYRVTTRQHEESGNMEVLVNGLVLEIVPVTSGKITNVPALPPNGQFEHSKPLLSYIAHDLYPRVLATSGSPADALEASVEFARSQHIVEFAKTTEDGPHVPAVVKFRDTAVETNLLPMNYDFEMGRLTGGSGITPENAFAHAEKAKRHVEERLQRGSVIAHSTYGGGQVEFCAPGLIEKFLADVELAATLPIHQAECVLSEIANPKIARSLAANLAAGVEEGLVSALANALALASNLERGTMMSAESARHAGTDRPAVDEAATEEDLP
jgi:hypothetical protein